MTGGVRVLQPAQQGPTTTPEIDTIQVDVDGELRERQRVAVAPVNGVLSRSETFAVPERLTAEVAVLVAPQHFFLRGFQATGTGDGRFVLLVDDAPVAADRIHTLGRSCSVTFPTGIWLAPGTPVTLMVTNDSNGLQDYEGTVFGEVTTTDG